MRNAIYLCPLLLCACGGGGDGNAPAVFEAPGSANVDFDGPNSGYFIGKATSPDEQMNAVAILTEDGQVRVHFGFGTAGRGPFNFIGKVDLSQPFAIGSGVVIGESCGQPAPRRFCFGAVSAEIRVAGVQRGNLYAEVVAYLDGELSFSWNIDLHWPDATYRDVPATFSVIEGTYGEEGAEFVNDHDLVTTIDGAGNIFFQSPSTGCTGNGQLTPYGDGAYNVYSVTLAIENCDASFGHLNTELNGLATLAGEDPAWGKWVVFLLSSQADSENDVALHMFAGSL